MHILLCDKLKCILLGFDAIDQYKAISNWVNDRKGESVRTNQNLETVALFSLEIF